MSILEKIVRHKQQEIVELKTRTSLEEIRQVASEVEPPLDFLAALKGAPPIRLIAEVKKASPSQGIIREDFDPVAIASDYQRAGAACLSVLTDREFFQGELEFIKLIRAAEIKLPILRKDFIIDPIQVWEARSCGADAVLLIAECLEAEQLKLLYGEIQEAGMVALVELYEEKNISAVMDLKPLLVGVNNRNLQTFKVDLNHCLRMKEKMGGSPCFVAESGIFTFEDAKCLQAAGVDAMLVGQSLCQQSDVYSATKSLLGTNPA